MNRQQLRSIAAAAVAIGATIAMLAAVALRLDHREAVATHGVIGVEDAHLSPDFWIARLEHPDQVIFDRASIETQNTTLMRSDESLYDLHGLPEILTRESVAGWIDGLAEPPSSALYDVAGEAVRDDVLSAIVDNRNLDAIAEEQPARFGLVVRRANLRTFPTKLRVFRTPGDTDIDRFQETALFPGTPVLVAHESADGAWWFVVSPRYAAWVEKRRIAVGSRAAVLAYQQKTPYRIVTGAKVDTVFTPEAPELSEVQLDMGVRVPVMSDWPADRPVNGQHPYNAHVIELPVRTAGGALRLQPALVQKNAQTAGDYLPLTPANIIRQGFKFLGERYGWGHSYNARDCSGFVSDVYQSMGILMPRNTSDQSVSPALHKRLFTEADDDAVRTEAARALEVGDLVYIPGHVMMVIGRIDGDPWVIHDTTGISYRQPEGELVRVALNAVSVTPLMPLQFSNEEHYIDRMTSIVRVAAESDEDVSKPL